MVEVNNCEYAELIEARNELDLLLRFWVKESGRSYNLDSYVELLVEKYDLNDKAKENENAE